MEVFIREKNCATCPFANKEKPNFICGDAIANDIGLKTNFSVCKLSYFANEESCPLKSLDQHDEEVRKQERQDIFMELNELKNYFDKRFNDFENNYEDETFSNIDMSNCYLDASFNLEYILEKLNEMKGEKENV